MLLTEFKTIVIGRTKLLVDNMSIIDLENIAISHRISKHVERRFHFLRDEVNKEMIELDFMPI